MKSKKIFSFMILCALFAIGCDFKPSSDQIQAAQQEKILAEGTAQTGMPAIKNFRERKMLKDILELRDQDGLVTYTYTWSDYQGKPTFFCDSIGYGIPCATQYTSPQKIGASGQGGYGIVPQADPNGLFSPASAEGTWILCKEPHSKNVRPQYVEPRIMVLTYKLDEPSSESNKKAVQAPDEPEK